MRPRRLADAAALAAEIPDGALLALPPDYAGAPMAVVRELVRRGARDLRLLGVPQLGLPAEILVGAGCAIELETAAVGLGEFGTAPCVERARRAGRLVIRESTCPAIHSALQAAEKGLPFLPVRGILGSDLLTLRSDWKVIDNPFPPHDPILLVPAIRPDVALFHAPLADAEGNLWIGVRRELMLMAHAARATLASVERIVEGSLLADPVYAPGTVPALYVTAFAEAPGGAAPTALWGAAPDVAAFEAYVRAAASEAGFRAWLEDWSAA
ncbi:MAG: CoA-transferase [Geminicoccaceae bacterium]|nr:CoA synthetase [Geminicoccaceae bacterium]MDW8124532.1 CoA-transferase [Geminicoccaceae bacterium]